MMAMDKDEYTRKQERDAQADLKRQQNALPAWHLKSTITGDLTALGVKENAREAAVMSMSSGSNDDILKGLGIIGGSSSRLQGGVSVQTVVNGTEDVKPVMNADADRMSYSSCRLVTLIDAMFICPVYDQYYASLAASSAAASAQATPTATGVNSSSSGSPSFPAGVGEDDEEDKKPNIEYLDSLNAYRKRSRSQEDVGAASKIKVAKTEETVEHANGNGYLNVPGMNGTNGINGNGHIYGHASQPDATMHIQESAMATMDAPEDDPMIMGT